ncbi:MAG: fibronectin type III domain-containing protein [Thermodesulfovibrionales bacterium]|nr:fibronectin type III domain-containing protein [Thermodesulfovibrionales bacterium]
MKTSGILALYCLLFVACLMPVSCGKKTAPTLKAYEKPSAPLSVKAIHREDRILLSWSYTSKKENLKEFHILRAEDSSFQKIASVTKEESSYTDVNFKTGAPYKYKVVAGSLKNILSEDSNIIAIKPEVVPSAPKNISFKVGNDALNVSWDSTGENVFYNIYRTAEKGKYSINPVNKEPLTALKYSDNLETGSPVYYTIRSLLSKEFRSEGQASGEIEVDPSTFIPTKPEGFQIVVADDKVVISWKENPEMWVTKYRVYEKVNEKDGFKLIKESATPAFTLREKMGMKHIFRVTAVGPLKESEPSEMITVDF